MIFLVAPNKLRETNIMRIDDNCSFCKKFGTRTTVKQKWYDKELLIHKNLVAVPALGPFSEGYLMILAREHYLSVASFPDNYLQDLLTIKHEVMRVIKEKFTAPIIFEHGPGTSSGGAGSCINHVHIHVCPTDIDLLPTLEFHHHLVKLDSFQDIFQFKNRPYIYYENQEGQMYMAEAQHIPGQYFRRLLAEALRVGDIWDYAAFPNYELIKSTISKLLPWPVYNKESE